MDIIRRNTDYALCLMIHLAEHYNEQAVSTNQMTKGEKIPYSLACKLLQKLQKHKLVESKMGPKGGFCLRKKPTEINLLEIIEVIQGPVCVNRCLLDSYSCPRKSRCPINGKLYQLQNYMKTYLESISLEQLVKIKS
ncbi:MAG: RrF2 family transcriptional regulator [Planctomycetota bacterium]|jgi:Rrf2 family protein